MLISFHTVRRLTALTKAEKQILLNNSLASVQGSNNDINSNTATVQDTPNTRGINHKRSASNTSNHTQLLERTASSIVKTLPITSSLTTAVPSYNNNATNTLNNNNNNNNMHNNISSGPMTRINRGQNTNATGREPRRTSFFERTFVSCERGNHSSST